MRSNGVRAPGAVEETGAQGWHVNVSLALVAAVGWGISSIVAGSAARRGSPLAVTFWSQFLGLLASLPALVFVGEALSAGPLLHGAIAGVGNGVSLWMLYSSARYLYIGVASAVSAVVACIIPVAYAAVTQPVSAREAMGVAVCVAALLSVARWRGDSRVAIAGVQSAGPEAISPGYGQLRQEIMATGAALASGVGLGIYYIAIAGTSAYQQVGEALESRFVSVLVLCVIALAAERSAFAPPRSTLSSAFLAGVLGVGSALAYAGAVRAGNLGIIVPVVSLSPAVTIAVAWLALSERLSHRQIAGLVLALTGVVIVTA